MGQYYQLFAQTEKGFETAKHSFDDFGGMKLMEHSYLENGISIFLQSKLATEWKGARIYHLGDYADMEYPEAKNVYNNTDLVAQRYVVNLDKKVFVDTWKSVPDNYGLRIDPVLLLTALGNGRGGGDYHSTFNLSMIGSWAGYRLSATNNIDDYKDYKEIYPLFIDDKEFNDMKYYNDSYEMYLELSKKIVKRTPMKILREMSNKTNISKELKKLILKEIAAEEDRSSQIVEDIKWFMFDDETKTILNSEQFSHDLNFVTWAGDGHSFIVTDYKGKEYRVLVQEEPQ